MKKKIFSIILARGGSKGIINKNLVKFNKRPLMANTSNIYNILDLPGGI